MARAKALSELTAKLHDCEKRHKNHPDKALETEVTNIREQIREYSLFQSKNILLKSRRTFYEYGDKCSRTLANAIRTQRNKAYIPASSTPTGSRIHDSKDMAESFRAFYEALYNLQSRPQDSPEAIETYLAAANLPTLNEEEVVMLSQPLTVDELTSALAGSPRGKAPGPDGFTNYYYKTFQAQLATHFVTAFNAILDNHAMPSDLLQASISVIPKPEKDPLLCASYRPISLLNCDLKLFTKILAERLGHVLQRIIPLDQVGFIRNREVQDNTTRTIDVVARVKRLNTPSSCCPRTLKRRLTGWTGLFFWPPCDALECHPASCLGFLPSTPPP